MIKISHAETYGWDAAIRGMRNPMNSWAKSDSGWTDDRELLERKDVLDYDGDMFQIVGDNDLQLMKTLAGAGSDHGKYLRMITVTCDIVAPLYWWKEWDTYKVSTIANSCSTMHKIHSKEFTLDDFSHEHLTGEHDERDVDESIGILNIVIDALNTYRKEFLATHIKFFWWQMIQLLPSSYNQRRTVQVNYQVLKNMYHSRKNHKLDEWRTLCDWMKTLPYSELITNE